ncbi:MAG: penicillin-insensitive murein endopeptidase [Bacteroidota bacterium]|nr:penicillin-insensitive murein endopeptidase [Bacteroidota bacterium]
MSMLKVVVSFLTFLFFIISILVHQLTAQVRIKEKVEIKPQKLEFNIGYTLPITTTDILKYRVSFDGSLKDTGSAVMTDPCGVHHGSIFPGGVVELTGSAKGGVASAVVIFYPATTGTFIQNWLIGDVAIGGDTIPITCTNCREQMLPQVNFYPGFTFSAHDLEFFGTIPHGSNFSNEFRLQYLDYFNFCQSPIWNPGFGTTLTITSGAHYGQFIDGAGNALGASVTVNAQEASRIGYRADGIQPDSAYGTVVITASSAGIEHSISFRVKNTVIHLKAIVESQEVEYYQFNTITAQALDFNGNATGFPPTDSTITFELIQGSQWGYLYAGAYPPEIRGAVVTVSAKKPYAGFFTYDDVEPDVAQHIVVRVSTSNPATQPDTASFTLLPRPLVVTATPPVIQQGQSTRLSVRQRLPDGTIADLGPDNYIYFYNFDEPSPGLFINADGSQQDSEWVDGDQPYATFVAAVDSTFPDSMLVLIGVGANEGDGLVRVLVLKKEAVSLKVSVDPSKVSPSNTGGNSQTTVTVLTTRGGTPVSGVPITFQAKGVEGTGGHNHNGRPAGTFTATSGTTDADGKFVSTYTASAFGGIERITAISGDVKDSADVNVKVGGLVELTGGSNYELVGTPNSYSGTNDPCRESPPTSLHYSNHYGIPDLISAVQNIASSYSSLHLGIKLRINDMSLPWGGLFDINNDWSTPHAEHRVGINADIGFNGIGENDGCTPLNKHDLLGQISKYTNGTPYIEGDHYHIRAR